jgi:hypothetical protein
MIDKRNDFPYICQTLLFAGTIFDNLVFKNLNFTNVISKENTVYEKAVFHKPLVKILRAHGGFLGMHAEEGRG